MTRFNTALLSALLIFCLATPALADKPVSPEMRINAAIEKIRNRPLRTDQHTPWVIMHAAIAFEQKHTVATPEGKTLNAIGFLLDGARDDEKNTRLYHTQPGYPDIRTRGIAPGFRKSFILQDHVDQFLYCYADADVPLTAKGKATEPDGSDQAFTVQDLLDASLRTFKPNQELGWTLVVTSHYLPIDKTWKTGDGAVIGIRDILILALRRDANRETEGGPHHLYGIAYALNEYQKANPGKPLEGPWKLARAYLDKHVAIVKEFQNEDGSFSSAMFRRKQRPPNARLMVWSTGHTIEWLTVALDAETLKEDWVRRAVLALADTINQAELKSEDNPHKLKDLSEGGMYHAAHALIRWRDKTK